MGLDKKRVLHSLGVAKKMKNLANELFPENDEFANDMFILGLLHDVGYELTTAQEEHADVAGNALTKLSQKSPASTFLRRRWDEWLF